MTTLVGELGCHAHASRRQRDCTTRSINPATRTLVSFTFRHAMAGVLLLHPAESDFETRRGCEALGMLVRRSITVGRGGEWASPISAMRSLRSLLGSSKTSFDCVHAWGIAALTVAAVASSRPIVFSPTRFPSAGDVRVVRAIAGARPIHIAVPTALEQRHWIRHGFRADQIAVIRPGVNSDSIERARIDSLRATLGIGADDFVILAPGETSTATNHPSALFAATILNVMDRRAKLLAWGRGKDAARLRRFAKRLKQPSFVDATAAISSPIEYESLLHVADAAVVTADRSAPTLPIAACMAAGLPIVAAANATTSAFLVDRRNALIVSRPTSRLFAERLLDLRDDATLRSSIIEPARADAIRDFSVAEFCGKYAALYEHACGRRAAAISPGRS